MGLTPTDRGVLEKLVDESLEYCPPFVNLLRDKDSPIGKHLKNVEDYVLGQMHGFVIGGYLDYISKQYTLPTPELLDEIQQVLQNRTPEMKEAIFKQG